jgi:hypothetical protein
MLYFKKIVSFKKNFKLNRIKINRKIKKFKIKKETGCGNKQKIM